MPKKSTTTSVDQETPSTKVTFEFFAPEAEEVRVAGSFSQWQEKASKLRKDKKGNWKLAVALAPGSYEYRYLVDGQWCNDQRNVEEVPNVFGSKNCLVRVDATSANQDEVAPKATRAKKAS